MVQIGPMRCLSISTHPQLSVRVSFISVRGIIVAILRKIKTRGRGRERWRDGGMGGGEGEGGRDGEVGDQLARVAPLFSQSLGVRGRRMREGEMERGWDGWRRRGGGLRWCGGGSARSSGTVVYTVIRRPREEGEGGRDGEMVGGVEERGRGAAMVRWGISSLQWRSHCHILGPRPTSRYY